MSRIGIRAVALSVVVVAGGCSDPGPSPEVLLQQVVQAQPKQVSPSEVAETMALGSNSTDVQRELMLKNLKGSVVQWDIQVYEIALDKGNYRVVSQGFPVKDENTVNLLRAVVTVTARNERDAAVLQSAKTGDSLTVKGRVQDIVLRGVVTIDPAILVGKP